MYEGSLPPLVSEWDQRTKIQVIDDLRVNGVQAYSNFSGSVLIATNGLPSALDSDNIFPLGSISNTTNVYCNENGYWAIFRSDEHGFNNPFGGYLTGQVDVMLTGDSFAEGACVRPEESIAAILRNTGLRVISLGKGGNGTLLEFASFIEYVKPIRPQTVIWMHYANDLNDLGYREMNSSFLTKYLQQLDYSQNLISRQEEVDQTLKIFIDDQYRKHKQTVSVVPEETNNRVASAPVNQAKATPDGQEDKKGGSFSAVSVTKVIEIMKLTRLRELTGLRPSRPDPAPGAAAIFQIILARVKESVSDWGGHLYLAYLPPYERYQTGRDHDVYFRNFVFRTANELDIPVIDIHTEVFKSHPDPLSLFPRRKARHYNARGYRLVAEAISRRFETDDLFR